MRPEYVSDKQYQTVKNGLFNSKYPKNYNLILGYSTPDTRKDHVPVMDIVSFSKTTNKKGL